MNMVAVVAIAIGVFADPLNAAEEDCDVPVSTYKYPGSSPGHRYGEGKWWRVNLDYRPRVAPSCDAPLELTESESPKYPLTNCSDDRYHCIRTQYRVFAVPRAEIVADARFTIEGADIKVQGCLRDSTNCRVSVFVSDCSSSPQSERITGEDQVVGSDCRLGGFGEKIVFIYDKVKGVIAYENAEGWSKAALDPHRGWDVAMLGALDGMMVLQEENGLLSCDAVGCDPRTLGQSE